MLVESSERPECRLGGYRGRVSLPPARPLLMTWAMPSLLNLALKAARLGWCCVARPYQSSQSCVLLRCWSRWPSCVGLDKWLCDSVVGSCYVAPNLAAPHSSMLTLSSMFLPFIPMPGATLAALQRRQARVLTVTDEDSTPLPLSWDAKRTIDYVHARSLCRLSVVRHARSARYSPPGNRPAERWDLFLARAWETSAGLPPVDGLTPVMLGGPLLWPSVRRLSSMLGLLRVLLTAWTNDASFPGEGPGSSSS